jgi:hypothetical protein
MEKRRKRSSQKLKRFPRVIDSPSAPLSLAKLCPHRALLRFAVRSNYTALQRPSQPLNTAAHASKNPIVAARNTPPPKRNSKNVLNQLLPLSKTVADPFKPSRIGPPICHLLQKKANKNTVVATASNQNAMMIAAIHQFVGASDSACFACPRQSSMTSVGISLIDSQMPSGNSNKSSR